ncbi:MAG: hypothetical protein DRG78_01285 [Epsilonproteobacteria bacterium]|nr:MAG: hypothetical protein DRG78_01285 [Campylobacterota bacterium]
MIDKLDIEAFKCFKKESLEFRNLTVLTGTNGSGKSSVIQAILQLALHSNKDYSSPLATYLRFVGDFNEAVNFNMDEKLYKISIDTGDKTNAMQVNNASTILGNYMIDPVFMSYSNGNLVFLSADRIGPQDIYDKNSNPLDKFGIKGEFAIDFLQKSKKTRYKVIDELVIGNETNINFLPRQVNYWLNSILDTTIETEDIPDTNQVKASFKNSEIAVRPKNMGSGISYVTSILIICLSAKIGQIIIIENPEIHLHPKAQSKLAEFLAFVASKGIQIIIETHNDHLINRFRYEVFEGNLKSDEIIIHYKEKDIPFEQIKIKEDGKFCNKNGENSFPNGFYDATLKEIFAINKGK